MLALAMAALAAAAAALPVERSARLVALAVVAGLLAASEATRGPHRRLSIRWLVPAALVAVPPGDAADRWGRALGSGVLTDAPYAVFHLAVAGPVVLGEPVLAAVVAAAFAAGRAVPYLFPAVRDGAERLADRTIAGRSALFAGARVASLVAVVGAAAAIALAA